MEQKKNIRKLVILLAILVVVLAVLLVLLLLLFNDPNPTEPAPTAPDLIQEMSDQRSLLLTKGANAKLTVTNPKGMTFTSSDPAVATVDSLGIVTAVGKGNALITIKSGEQVAYCGVIVDGEGSMIDIRNQSAQTVFSDILLHSQMDITGVAVDVENEAFYITQKYGASAYNPLTSDTIITKVSKLQQEDGTYAWHRGAWMRFFGSGMGSISLDNDGDTVRLWMESNGSYMGYGTTISLVEWEDFGVGHDRFGQTIDLIGTDNLITLTADPEHDQVLVYDRGTKSYLVYDRSDLLSGASDPAYIHKFSCVSHQTPELGTDDSQGRYNASVRGYALYDGFVYQLSGGSSIYLSVFDLEGNLQYCHRVTDFEDTQLRKPAALAVVDGKIYMIVASGVEGTCYLANAWVFG